jgi:hypothetical protein
MNNQFKSSPLDGFEPESELARRKGVNQATIARRRKQGKYRYLEWGGRIWIETASADADLRSQIKRRNPPRVARRRRLTAEGATL